MRQLADHGLPLVQLKEQRRDLIVALQNRNGPVSGWELMQIAAVQQAISAFEDVIADLDAEMEAAGEPFLAPRFRWQWNAGLQIARFERGAFARAKPQSVAKIVFEIAVVGADGFEGGGEERRFHRPEHLSDILREIAGGGGIAAV